MSELESFFFKIYERYHIICNQMRHILLYDPLSERSKNYVLRFILCVDVCISWRTPLLHISTFSRKIYLEIFMDLKQNFETTENICHFSFVSSIEAV